MNKYIRLITFVALASILFLQGLWLFNTYKLVEAEFEKNISSELIFAVQKENIFRMGEVSRIAKELGEVDPTGKEFSDENIVEGAHPNNDMHTNVRALQDFSYKKGYPVSSLEKIDTFFNEGTERLYKNLSYSLLITDSLENEIASISHIQKKLNKHTAYTETVQIRNIAPEYITLTISSPHKIIFGEMLLLLIGSLILAVIVVCCLIYQIGIILRQNKIAQLRQDFTHAMIHDMKNPIMSILSGASALKTGKLDDKPQVKERYYSIITQEGERILNLTNKILEIAKFESGQAMLSNQQVNLHELLTNLTEKYKLNATKKVHFTIELNEIENIYADPYYICEAFGNLIDNAIKYSKENEDAEIYITGSAKNNNTKIVFRDNGIGISEKDKKRIFQKFERAMSVIKNPKKISGFGLGLNFVYQVIKAHGGTIDVNSRLGSYSEFIINLPYSEDDENN